MRLELRFDQEALRADLELLDRRLYVVSTLIPDGFEPYFREEARFARAHSSTAIEGNPLGIAEARMIYAERGGARDYHGHDKLNLIEAYDLLDQLAEDASVQVDEGLIRTVNSIVLRDLPELGAENRGRYRLRAGSVVDEITGAVRYLPPAPHEVAELMQHFVADLRAWREEHAPPVAAALTHFGLVSIHPFENGNGRTARAAADFVLDQDRRTANRLLSISQAILDSGGEYEAALSDTQSGEFQERVDVTPFLRYHTKVLYRASDQLEERAVELNRLRERLAAEGLAADRAVLGLLFMHRVGPLSAGRYAGFAEVSRATAVNDLRRLIDQGVVVRVGQGKNTRYTLSAEVGERLGHR